MAASPSARKNEKEPSSKVKITDISKPSQYKFFCARISLFCGDSISEAISRTHCSVGIASSPTTLFRSRYIFHRGYSR